MTEEQAEGGDVDGDREGGDSEPAAVVVPQPPRARGKRRVKLREVADVALHGEGHLMVADPANARMRAIFSGRGIEQDRADLEKFGDSAKRLGRLFHSLTESRPQIFALDFGKSVTVEIGPPEDEVERAAQALRQVADEDDDKRAARLLASAVPETTLAAYATRDLLLASEDDVVAAALSYGASVTDAYKSFVRHLADEMISLNLSLPTDDDETASAGGLVVAIDSEQAASYREALTAVGTDEVVKVKAVGTLTMADSGSRQIRLTLAPDAAKDPAVRRHRAITAGYTGRAGAQIEDLGLWNKEVRADFEMTRDRRGTTTQLRRPTFSLIAATPRYE
jgi:hypothetical protein